MILDKPVKTYLMSAIQTVLDGITQIKQVKYGQGIPIDQDTAVYPWTCFFDEAEDKIQRGRIAMKSFDLVVQTFVKKGSTTIDDQMDLIDAEFEKNLTMENEGIKHYAMKFDPGRSEKFVVDDQETGILQSVFKVQYSHGWKNPYELVKIA